MYKTNTHCSSGLTKSSIIILPLDVTSTMCVSEKLIWCLGGERHCKISLRVEPSCRPCRSIFDAFRPCSASLKLDLREYFKGSAFPPFARLFLERAQTSFWETAAPDQSSKNCTSRRADTAGKQEKTWAGAEGRGGGGETWRRNIIYICMRHPALPSSPAAARAGAKEGGDGERWNEAGRGDNSSS